MKKIVLEKNNKTKEAFVEDSFHKGNWGSSKPRPKEEQKVPSHNPQKPAPSKPTKPTK